MSARPYMTEYFGPGRGKNKPIVRTTYGSNPHELLPNIMRRMTQNLDGAVVAVVTGTEYGELQMVVTMFPGESIRVAFKRGFLPILLTNLEDLT